MSKPAMPKPIGYASIVDLETYAPYLKIGPHLPGVRDMAMFTKDQFKHYAARFDHLSAEAERLRHAGRMLSNCAFNLAQRNPGEFTKQDIEALDRARKAWDEALKS